MGKAFAYGFSDGYDNFLYISDTALFQFVENESHVTAYIFEQTKHELIYDTYYRIALPLILQARGKEVIHASAIISGDQITVFCANSGTGKSTLAYALYLRGYELGADDAVAIEIIRSKAIAVPLPFRIRLLADSERIFFIIRKR